jgi:hypothetical protein
VLETIFPLTRVAIHRLGDENKHRLTLSKCQQAIKLRSLDLIYLQRKSIFQRNMLRIQSKILGARKTLEVHTLLGE